MINDRINQNNKMVDELLNNDYIKFLIEKFNLEKYKYIDDVKIFSLLTLRGSMKYINKYTGDLRYGGLLIKIYQKDSKWFGIIKKGSGKKYHVSFNNNHIFYLEHKSKNQKLRNTLELLMDDIDHGKYIISN